MCTSACPSLPDGRCRQAQQVASARSARRKYAFSLLAPAWEEALGDHPDRNARSRLAARERRGVGAASRRATARSAPKRRAAGRSAPASGMSRAASFCRASGSRGCSIPARRFSSSRRSPRTECTARRSPAPASSPGSGASSGRLVDDRLQRRHGEGRHLLSDDGEEASPRAGDRAGEPAALHLSGRFRRREPAAPDRGLSRPRAFRPHLLQSGEDVGGRHSADRLRHGLVHGGRRLRAGDVGRDGHREGAGDDLSRPARRW